MGSINVESVGQVVRVNTNSQKLEDILERSIIPSTIIPGYNIGVKRAPEFELFIEENSFKRGIFLDKDKKQLKISYTSTLPISPYPFTYSLFYVFNKLYQEDGLFYLHGSAISRDGKGALLLGCEDWGKSRVALKLCLDYGFKLNGDEGLIFNPHKRKIIEGVKLIQMSKDKIDRYFSNSLLIAKKEFNTERDKVILDSTDLGIFKVPGEEIDLIFYTHICPDVPRFVKIEEGDARRKFFEKISENIRGHGYILLDIDTPYPSLDSPGLSEKRATIVKNFIKDDKLQTYFIRNSLDKLCEKINEIFES